MVEMENNGDLSEIKGVVVAKFGAAWCGPCRMIGPVLEVLDNELEDVTFVNIDIDENQELTQKMGIKSVPTIYIMKNGEVLDSFLGMRDKDFILNRIKLHSL